MFQERRKIVLKQPFYSLIQLVIFIFWNLVNLSLKGRLVLQLLEKLNRIITTSCVTKQVPNSFVLLQFLIISPSRHNNTILISMMTIREPSVYCSRVQTMRLNSLNMLPSLDTSCRMVKTPFSLIWEMQLEKLSFPLVPKSRFHILVTCCPKGNTIS
jgi:hypothetical protein